VSPSRGLLVFCPYLLVAAGVMALRCRAVRRDALFWLAASWLMIHLAMVARPFRWYGGHCYGPRLFTEAIPAVMVLTLIAFEQASQWSPPRRRAVGVCLFLASAVSIFMHTYQGLFNEWTSRWNTSPNIDLYEADLFKWRYAQFLASPQLVGRREVDHATARLPKYQPGLEVSAADSAVIYFQNLKLQPPDSLGPSRRTIAARSAIWFVPGLEMQNSSTARLRLVAAVDSRKRVFIRVNGVDASILRVSKREASLCASEFPTSLLKPNVPNEISFEIYPSDSPDSNLLPGMRIWSVRIEAH